LADIRAGPIGTRRAKETVFIMKIVHKDKKGKKRLDSSSPQFQDYLQRFEDILCVGLMEYFKICFNPRM
jgi:hypothetical protein